MHTIIILLLPGIVLGYDTCICPENTQRRFPGTVLEYDMICPDYSQRQFRSHGLCASNTKSVYTCLEDVFKRRLTFIESCSDKEDVVRPGKRYVIKGKSTIGDCSTDRYQPLPFYKTSGSLCMYLKSKCTEVGQVVASNGPSLSDTTCICDYTEGYAYVIRPKDVCSCVPSEEDCTCYKKLCPENHHLSAENECIFTNATSMTECAEIDRSEKNIITIFRTDSTALNKLSTGVKNAKNAAICVTVTISVMILIINETTRPIEKKTWLECTLEATTGL